MTTNVCAYLSIQTPECTWYYNATRYEQWKAKTFADEEQITLFGPVSIEKICLVEGQVKDTSPVSITTVTFKNQGSIVNVEPPSTEPSTAKFFKILEYTQLTVRQISSGSSQNWSIGTDFTHVPRVCRQWLHSSWAPLSWAALDSILHDIYSALQIPIWKRAWSLVLCIK